MFAKLTTMFYLIISNLYSEALLNESKYGESVDNKDNNIDFFSSSFNEDKEEFIANYLNYFKDGNSSKLIEYNNIDSIEINDLNEDIREFKNFTLKKARAPRNIPEKQNIDLYSRLCLTCKLEESLSKYSSDFIDKKFINEAYNSAFAWEAKYLEPIFVHGVINYLFWYFTGLDTVSGEYEKSSNKETKFSNPDLIEGMSQSPHFVHYFNMLLYVHYQLQHNELFQRIGIHFLKEYFELNKLQKDYKNSKSPDNIKKQLVNEISNRTIRIQILSVVLICWVKDVVKNIEKIIEESLASGDVIDYKSNDFIKNINNLRPKFLDDPYWAQVLTFINEHKSTTFFPEDIENLKKFDMIRNPADPLQKTHLNLINKLFSSKSKNDINVKKNKIEENYYNKYITIQQVEFQEFTKNEIEPIIQSFKNVNN